MDEGFEGFEIRGEFITLGQLLKVLGIAMTGGEAKLQLEEGEFQVNGEPETRRGRKLRPGDTVTFPDGAELPMIGDSALAPPADTQGGDQTSRETHQQQDQEATDQIGQGNHNPTKRRLTQRTAVRRRRRAG
jgi:ribosome-associated protein